MGPKSQRLSTRRSVLLVALLGLSAPLLITGCSVFFGAQRRYLLEVKNRTEVPSQYQPLTYQEFLALPPLHADYTASDWDVVRAQSDRAVSLEGYIAEVRQIHDGLNYGRWPWNGDLHVHLRDKPQPRCFTAEGRGTQIVTEVTPSFQPPKTAWSLEALRGLCERQVRVRISGWLLHDFQHLDGIGIWRASAWEIHPVTKFEVWEAERQAWQPFL
jgi:hypothetical protein